ncbi:MAG: ATP-binding cassette domain-containing protein [Bacteroidales bacterium]|nr:ATP-binding cassette domain-containing protein [Bacteroidales bacterium]
MDTQPIILLQHATIKNDDYPVLQNVNLTVNKGEFVYLIGKSGAGKTTLFRSLYADTRVSEGEALVCGYDMTKIKKSKIPLLRRKIGIVFQNFKLLNDRNVYDNLRFVMRATGWKNKNDIDERILKVIEAVGLPDKVLYPIHRLSEGEQQRVGIARALLNNPELILADEPTGNLDPQTSEEIMNLFLRINREYNTTLLISTHDYIMIDKFKARLLYCENHSVYEPNNIKNTNE